MRVPEKWLRHCRHKPILNDLLFVVTNWVLVEFRPTWIADYQRNSLCLLLCLHERMLVLKDVSSFARCGAQGNYSSLRLMTVYIHYSCASSLEITIKDCQIQLEVSR